MQFKKAIEDARKKVVEQKKEEVGKKIQKEENSTIDKIFFKKKPADKKADEVQNPFAQFAVKLDGDKKKAEEAKKAAEELKKAEEKKKAEADRLKE